MEISFLDILKPDDWHVHFRDNEIMKAVVPETTRHFARAIVMPNLIPPILNEKQAIQYKKRIMKAIPKTHSFEPLMTIYLTEKTNKNIGCDIYIDRIPTKYEMNSCDILISESQERMLIVAQEENKQKILP